MFLEKAIVINVVVPLVSVAKALLKVAGARAAVTGSRMTGRLAGTKM
jgi:hypothetical protein